VTVDHLRSVLFLTPSARRLAGPAPVTVIPYERFLERQAWRAKIAHDFRLLAAMEQDLAVRPRGPSSECDRP
jgi:hypothetical protein